MGPKHNLALIIALGLLNRLCLVDRAAIRNDPTGLIVFVRSMISGEQEKFLSLVSRHDRS